jgi:hypothetical protein
MKPNQIVWREDFTKAKNWPYSTMVLYELLPDAFPRNNIVYNKNEARLFYPFLEGNHNYIFIQNSFGYNSESLEILLQKVNEGNNLFVAAQSLSNELTDSLGFYVDYFFEQKILKNNDNYILTVNGFEEEFKFNSNDVNRYFSFVDSSAHKAKLLGFNQHNNPVFISYQLGKGNLFLHANPKVFTNFYMVKNENAQYASQVFSHLPNLDIVWDEYENIGIKNASTPIRFLLTNPSFKAAYWTLLVGILLFMLMEFKRRQREIPIIEPFKNSSLEFIKIISSLYLEEKNNTDIAKKRIKYFVENLSRTYRLKISLPIDEDSLKQVSLKKGADIESLKELFEYMTFLQKQGRISEEQLIHLNRKMEDI